LCQAIFNAASFGVGLAKTDTRKLWIDKYAVRNQPIPGRMLATSEIVAHDSEIVEGHVCKMRADCAVPHRPHVWRSRLKPLLHLDVAPLIQLDAGSFQADSLRIRCLPF